jgi:hypothetical protein
LAATGIANGDASGLNLFTLAPSYTNYTNDNFTVQSVYLPIRYTHYFSSNNALIVDMPFNFTSIDGAQTYSAALGLGFMHMFIYKPNFTWAITPSAYAGAVGSIDMGSGTLVYDGAVASRITLPHDRMTYGMTNDVSYLKTAQVTIGSVTTPYDLDNTMTQNGVDATYQVSKSFSLGGYYTRTDILGGATWYIPSYNQVGFKLAKIKNFHQVAYDHISLIFGYIFADNSNYNGVNGTLTFNF